MATNGYTNAKYDNHQKSDPEVVISASSEGATVTNGKPSGTTEQDGASSSGSKDGEEKKKDEPRKMVGMGELVSIVNYCLAQTFFP